MPLNDIDVVRRRSSIGFPIDLVDYIIYSYNEQTFEEKHFQSIHQLFNLIENETENNKSYWIEVINRSSVNLPNSIQLLCEYFDIHPLTIEDITTLASCMKLDLFYDQPAIYILMKIISWNGQRVEQQQISFYLKCSQNILITFQEKSTNDRSVFDPIRNHLRGIEQSPYHPHNRLKQMNIDYLFYCLFDAIIDRYILVIEEIGIRIDHFDVKLMTDKQSLTSETFYSIYRLKHDLLHLRILFNPLIDIIHRLQRTTQDERFLLYPHTESSLRLDMKHHIIRRQITTLYPSPLATDSLTNTTMNLMNQPRRTSKFFNQPIYIYLSDLNDHINQLIDSLELQRESVSILISFWLNLSNNETQETLKFLMLISALFMPCMTLVGIYSTNFQNHPDYAYQNGRYILFSVLATIIIGMITWYKFKGWI